MTTQCHKCNSANTDTARFCSDCGTQLVSTKDVSVTKTLQAPLFSLGKTIASKYKILSELGRGGMGVVYKAKDTKLKRTVALKFLPAELTKDKEAKKRFIQEAQASAALEHPNICTVYEVDETEDQIFIAMSYVEGKSLKDKLKDGPLDIDEAKDIALQVAEGLKEAHDKGIVHRDIKPANIMLTKKGQAKITDFGLAKLSWGVGLTKTSTIMGTVAYMSPEQAKGENVDHRTDIWSLGAMLYEILVGERPFIKDHEQALIFSILNDEPKSVSSLRSELPNYLESTIQKALEKNRTKRFQSVDEFIEAMKHPIDITTPKDDKSIAVLPFTNMSADPEQEYFCDGIAEELINALTHVKDLHVVARTSAFSFKGEKMDVREIGKRLNVEAVLEGSVRRSGDRLRITAQLINISDGYHLWSERFDREMRDIFDIQDEITLAIVDKLKVKLLRREKEALAKRYTEDVEAYNLYLKGMHFVSLFTAEGYEKAIRCFQQALQKDPNYALIYHGLALVEGTGYLYRNVPPYEAYPKAREYLQKALEIDNALGEAHAYMGWIHAFYDWNWKEAEKKLKLALELNPDYAEGHIWYSEFLAVTERNEEALREAKRAQALDPLSSWANGEVGEAFWRVGQYDRAIEEFIKALKIEPDNHRLHFLLGFCYLGKSMFEEAIEEYEKAVELSGRNPFQEVILAITYCEIGKKVEAEKLFESLKKRSKDEYVPPLCFFYIHLARGEEDNALEWLERACKERESYLTWIRVMPFDFLRIPEEPKYQDLLKKYGLEKYS